MKLDFDKKQFLKQYGFLIIVLALFVLSFWLRSFPARYGDLQALDPFYHYRMGEYVLSHNFQLPERDMMRFYPLGVDPGGMDYLAPIYMPAYSYAALSAIGMQMTFLEWGILWPALIGALAVVVMFFVGKELFNSKVAGFFAAFFLAVMPAFITRTSAGFLEKEPTASVFMMLSVLFFIRAYKRSSWVDGIMAGFFLAVMSTAWGGAAYIFLLYASFALILFVIQGLLLIVNYLVPGRTKNMIDGLEKLFDGSLLKAYIPTIILGFFLHQMYAKHFVITTTYIQLAFAGVGLLLIRYLVKNFGVKKFKMIKDELIPYIIPGLIVLLIVIVVFGSMFFEPFNHMLGGIINIGPESRSLIGTTVAENNPGSWNVITNNLSTSFSAGLLPFFSGFSELFAIWLFMLLGSFLLIYEFCKTRNWLYVFMLIWILSGIWGVMGMVRLTFLLGPPAALCAAFFLHWIIKKAIDLKIMKSAETIKSKIKIYYITVPIALLILFTLIFNFASGFVYSQQLGPSLNSYWKEGLTFLSEETPQDSVILSWWDYGYWFQWPGNRASVADGGNMVGGINEAIADWFMSPVDNWNEWVPWMKEHGVTHIVMDYSMPGKIGAITKIGSRGESMYGFLQFQQTDTIENGGETVVEFRSGPYVLWLPSNPDGTMTKMPLFFVAQGDQFVQKNTITKVCDEKGITELGTADDSVNGCLYLGKLGVFFILPELENSIFVSLMFMDGHDLPVKKVFDNTYIRIYEVNLISNDVE